MLPIIALSLSLSLSLQEPSNTGLTWIDIHAAGYQHVQALKLTPGVQAWAEFGDVLLLEGTPKDKSAFSGEIIRQSMPNMRLSQLAILAPGCNDLPPPPAERVVYADGMYALLRGPASFVAYGDAMGDLRKLQPNQVYLRNAFNEPTYAQAKVADPLIQGAVDAVDVSRWFNILSGIAAFNRSSYGTEIFSAREYLLNQFSAIPGLTVAAEDFTFNPGSGNLTRQNVVARLTGISAPNEWLVIGAHYDSRQQIGTATANTPGAEDNASGCAAVVELARILAPRRPARTVIFSCYAGEEQGLFGSRAQVTALTASGDLTKVVAMLNMDMIGYSGDADLDVFMDTNTTGNPLRLQAIDIAATYAPETRVVSSTALFGRSDHQSYTNAGKQALQVGENDAVSQLDATNAYPFYHNTMDVPANITRATQMGGGILKINAALSATIAQISEASLFANGFEN
jgi:hypothetical protein